MMPLRGAYKFNRWCSALAVEPLLFLQFGSIAGQDRPSREHEVNFFLIADVKHRDFFKTAAGQFAHNIGQGQNEQNI